MGCNKQSNIHYKILKLRFHFVFGSVQKFIYKVEADREKLAKNKDEKCLSKKRHFA